MRRKPERPARSLRDFVNRLNRSGLDIEWPCLTCYGHGWLYDPKDPPCPVEGNRNRRALRCDACNGTGAGSKTACKEAYRKAIAEYEAEKRRYEGLIQTRKEALKRLTKRQIEALKELGA